ncbi:MAG: Uma2 family endonuclease [Thioploca sp.]|nr:Uma2 family endonuclease [Thioploca sp.]
MQSALAEQQTPLELPEPQSTVLSPISWQTYESLLKDLEEEDQVQLTYDQERLEIIMSPLLLPHERYSTLIHDFIRILGDELALDICSLGSTTLRRQDLQCGLEPDKSYYIQHENQVRDQQILDLTQLPPPDLVVEVDMTNPSLKKLPIYLVLGVPELWRYDGEMFDIYQKIDNDYVKCEVSLVFNLPLCTIIPELLKKSFRISERIVLSEFRQWVRKQIGSVNGTDKVTYKNIDL